MQHSFLRICAAAMALSATAAALAFNIRGTVAESGTLEPLIQASVRLLAQRDSAIVKTAVSDIDGNFKLEGVKAGRYIVEASYVGYTPQTRNVNLQKNMRLDTLLLSPGSIMLKEATVVEEVEVNVWNLNVADIAHEV